MCQRSTDATATPAFHPGSVGRPPAGDSTNETEPDHIGGSQAPCSARPHDRLGPEADSLAMRIDSCRTIEEFRYRVREAERLISTALGASAAQEYLKALRRG